jgi:transposase
MRVYVGIDLHSNNCYLVILDEEGHILLEKKLANDLGKILQALAPFKERIAGVVVESTFNWYWLVDGLMDEGYSVHLANTCAIKRYEGLKYTDDKSDARWLAQMLQMGILPEGFIYPKEERQVRDLLRKRSQLVRHKTAHTLSIQNLFARNLGRRFGVQEIRKLSEAEVDSLLPSEELAMAVKTSLSIFSCLSSEIEILERAILAQVRIRKMFDLLLTIAGVGKILGLTIMLETGDVKRFVKAGNYASYCRCVGSAWISNGKRKGQGNVKNGNKYLAWAFIEAATYAVRFYPEIKRFYERKKVKTNGIVAIKAVAHKLARAAYHMMKDETPFDIKRAFA